MTFNALTSCFEFSTVLLSVSPIFIFMHMKWENKFFGFTKKQILMFSAATISLLCLACVVILYYNGNKLASALWILNSLIWLNNYYNYERLP